MTDETESDGSIIKLNAIADPNYAPYCLRCPRLVRMIKVETFYWKCLCGAEHDEREQESDTYYNKQS